MDLEAQRKFALAVCDSKRTRKQYIALKRKFVLSCNRARRASPSSSYDCDDCAVSNSAFVGSPRVIGGSQQKSKVFNVLDELWRVSQVPKNRRRFSAALIAFAMSVYLLSGTAYEHLRKFMPLPSWQTLQVRTQPCFKFNANTLHNLSMIPDTVDRFREQEQIGHEIVYGILAVDAVSFQRELIVTKNGMMEGSLSNETLDSAKLAELHESFTEFENFWKLHHDAIISDAFVFQFQPINASLRSFIVHIKPSTQGKATEATVELLREIDQRLEGADLVCLGYAMDGDTAYSKLHKTFYANYSRKIKIDPFFNNFSLISNTRLIISDPLHVLKRARYRLLATDTYLGMTKGSDVISIDVLKSVLSLPSKVFSEQKFTKMHDDLPISLFSLSSLVEIYEKQPGYAAYFLPFCLLNAALSEKGLCVEERINFLEVSFYYMMAYVEELSVTSAKLPDRKSPTNRAVRLFPLALATEHCNTVASLLAVLYGFNTTINLNRLGTNPLEHTFGLIRMRSRYRHTYQNMLRTINATMMWKSLANFLGVGSRVSGRRTYYGQTVAVSLGISPSVLSMTPRDVAICHHLEFGLPISSLELEAWNMEFLVSHSDQIVSNFMVTLASIYRRLYPQAKAVRLNSRSICVCGGQNLCMIKREGELQ